MCTISCNILFRIDERLNNVRALNGNAELFLALQDLTMPQFLNKLFAAATIQNKGTALHTPIR